MIPLLFVAIAATVRSSDRRHLSLTVRIVSLAFHAPAPFGVEVSHAAFVVDRHVFLAAVEHPRSFATRMHGATLAMHTKQPLERIEMETDRDRYFTAQEAKEYGFIDEVIEKERAAASSPASA